MDRSFGDTISRIFACGSVDLAQDYVKYWGNRYLARCLGDQVPFQVKAEFESRPLFSGPLKVRLRNALHRRDASLFYSLAQAKRGWGPLSDERRDEALRDHAKSLGGPSPELGLEERKYLDKAIRLVLGRRRFSSASFQPSSHGYVGAPAMEGGAAGYLQRQGFRPDLPVPGESRQAYLVRLNVALEDYYRRLRSELRRRYGPAVSPAEGSGGPDLLTAVRRTEVVALPEPAKFRLISKGDPLEYSLLQPLQGFLLSIWHDCPFSTMKGEDVGPRLEGMEPRDFWNNGDYSKATDYLSSEASWYVLQRICTWAKVPTWLWDLAVGSLLSNELIYPPVKGEPIAPIRQTNGQLMGHPLSFPLLCIINLATFLYATAFRPSLSKDCLINGDDICFPCTEVEFKRWKGFARGLGLVISPGKSYLSKEYALINSQLFDLRKRRRVGYLNLKLVLGTSLKGGGITSARQIDISRSLNDMLEFATAYRWWPVSDWLRPYAPVLVPGINWFIPAHRGGLGLDRSLSFKPVIPTRWQRKLAGATYVDPTLSLSSGIKSSIFRLVVGVIGTPRAWSSRREWAHLASRAAKRQAVYEAWFRRLSSDFTALTGVETTLVRPGQLIVRWRRAALYADPCSEEKCFEPPQDMWYPLIPAIVQRGLGLRVL